METAPLVRKGQRLEGFRPIADVIESQPPSKALHGWEQSPIEAEHIISKLTIQDDVVFDPLMGATATGMAA